VATSTRIAALLCTLVVAAGLYKRIVALAAIVLAIIAVAVCAGLSTAQ
jgi:hypothetical protein